MRPERSFNEHLMPNSVSLSLSVYYHLNRQVDHDMVEILPGEEVIVHLVFLGSVQLGEGLRPTESLF